MGRGSSNGQQLLIALAAVILVLAGPPPEVDAQPYNPFLDDEAPEAVFSLDRDDADVDFYILGSWRASSVVATGLAIHGPRGNSRQRVTFPFPYPGHETRLFAQELDITFSLWLYSQYFFEASFADNSDLNSLSAGYFASGDGVVREVIAGTVPLTVDAYPYMYTGSEDQRSGNLPLPGVRARLATDRTSHEVLVQLESSRGEARTFRRGGEILENRINPGDFVRRAAFMLPHAPVRDVTLLLEDRSGDIEVTTSRGNRMFRAIPRDEGVWILNEERGEIRLTGASPPQGALAVLYNPVENDASGIIIDLDEEGTPTDRLLPFPLVSPGGDSTLGGITAIPLDSYRITATDGTRPALRGVLLADGGLYSPFEDPRFYRVPPEAQGALQSGEAIIRLVRRGTALPHPEERQWRITGTPQGTLLRVERIAPAAASREETRLLRQYPFVRWAAEGAIYGASQVSRQDSAPGEILLEYRSDAPRVVLDDRLVPGTVRVTRDGRAVSGVTVDYSTGEITLPDSIPPDGTLDIRYRVYTPGTGTRDLVAVSGNRWTPTERLSLSLAGGVRWTVNPGGFSSLPDEHPGQAVVSVGGDFQGDRLRLSASLAGQLNQYDTTGWYRLFGGDRQVVRITPGSTTVFPAPSSTPADPSVQRFSPETRGYALYRDHWDRDLAGNPVSGNYRTAVDPDPRDRSGARMGPFTARSTDAGFTGPVAVLEWDELAPEEWLGTLIRSPLYGEDVRDATAVTVNYRFEPLPGGAGSEGSSVPPVLVVQLGSTGEDLDDDGRIDRGRSTADPTLEFRFPAGHRRSGEVRRVGPDVPGLPAPHQEDKGQPGALMPEVPDALVTITGLELSPHSQWQSHRVELTPAESSRLGALRGVQFFVRPGDDNQESLPAGRLIIGAVELERSGSATLLAGRPRGAVATVVDDPVSPSLRESAEEVRNRFTAGSEKQPVLQIRWATSGELDPPAVTAAVPVEEFSPARYNTLGVFLYLHDETPDGERVLPDDLGDATVTIEMLPYPNAPEADRLVIPLQAAALLDGDGGPRWQEVRVDLRSGRVAYPGSPATHQENTSQPRARLPRNSTVPLRVATVSLEGYRPGGTLLLDELHATDPQAGGAMAGQISAEWSSALGDGRIMVRQDLAAQTREFQDISTGTAGGIQSATRGEYRRGALRTAGEVIFRGTEDAVSVAAGHDLGIPLAPGGIILLEEQFFRDFDDVTPVRTRSMALSGGNPAAGRYRVHHANRSTASITEQRWGWSAAPPSAGAFRLGWKGQLELRSLDETLEEGSYQSDWLQSTVLLISASSPEETRQERRATSAAAFSLGPFAVEPGVSWQTRGQEETIHISGATISSTLPFTIARDARRPLRITPMYRRSFRGEIPADSQSFGEDFAVLRETLSSDPVILQAIPVVELFQRELPGTRATEAGEYTTEGRIRIARPFASRLADLWIPHEAELATSHRTAWEADTITPQRQWDMIIRSTAVNLFGTQGSFSRFSAYQSDEFHQRVTLELREEPPGNIASWRIEARQETKLFGLREDELLAVTRAGITRADTRRVEAGLTASYTWISHRAPPFSLFSRADPAPYYRNREELTWNVAFENGALHTMVLEAGHATTLVPGRLGEIRWFTNLGWTMEIDDDSRDSVHYIGIQAGIEGVLSW